MMEDYEQTKADKIMQRIVAISNDYDGGKKNAETAIMQIYNILKSVAHKKVTIHVGGR